jgi:CO dehydrogenase maturation factor
MCKISIVGKGGVGKSVFGTLLGTILAEDGFTVLIVDSDESNPGLYRMLGFNKAPMELMDLFGGEKKVLRVRKSKVDNDSEAFFNDKKIYLKDIPPKYLMEKGNLKLASLGKITGAFEGCACPMAEALKLFLGKLALNKREVIVVDMEAGVEHFGRGVESKIDSIIVVVEPSFESIALTTKINFLALKNGVDKVSAVVNKVTSPTIDTKLREELAKRGIKVIGSLFYDEELYEHCFEGKSIEGLKVKESVRRMVPLLF